MKLRYIYGAKYVKKKLRQNSMRNLINRAISHLFHNGVGGFFFLLERRWQHGEMNTDYCMKRTCKECKNKCEEYLEGTNTPPQQEKTATA